MWLETDEMPEVTDILRVRGREGRKSYLVQYKNRDCMYCTWEPEKAQKLTCAELIAHFKRRRIEREPGALSFVMTHEPPLLVVDTPTVGDGSVSYSRMDYNPALELIILRSIPVKDFFVPTYVGWKQT